MNYDEFKELCRKSWEEDYNYFILIDLKREIKENIVFVMKAKNVYRSNTSDETFLIIIQNCNLFSNLLNVIFN